MCSLGHRQLQSFNGHVSALTYPARCWVLTKSVTITISLHLHHSPKRRVTYYLHVTLHKNKAPRTEMDVLGAGLSMCLLYCRYFPSTQKQGESLRADNSPFEN